MQTLTPSFPTLEQRVAALPISEAERHQALGYVATGEAIADAIISVIGFLQPSPAAIKHIHLAQ
jgi:hypothetical protein